MDYRKENDEVLYPREKFVNLSKSDIEFLKAEALKNPRQRIRICTHQGPEDKVHEMFIVHTKDAYVRPHKHIHRAESLFVLEGEVEVVFFNDGGEVIKRVAMGPMASGKMFYYRLVEPWFHTLCIKSDEICFYETTSGPFTRTDTEFASWAPDGSNPAEAKAFIQGICSK